MLILLVELQFQRIFGLIYLVFSTFDIPIPFKKIVFLMLNKKLRNLKYFKIQELILLAIANSQSLIEGDSGP